jgi:hypothetical protein
VREALAQWFNWHRRTQLPDYAALLPDASEANRGHDAARVCEWQVELLRPLRHRYDRAGPAIANRLRRRRADRAHSRSASQGQREFRDDYLQPDRAKRAAATLKAHGRALPRHPTGKLDADQRERVAAPLNRSPFDPEVLDCRRRARQQDEVQLIASS